MAHIRKMAQPEQPSEVEFRRFPIGVHAAVDLMKAVGHPHGDVHQQVVGLVGGKRVLLDDHGQRFVQVGLGGRRVAPADQFLELAKVELIQRPPRRRHLGHAVKPDDAAALHEHAVLQAFARPFIGKVRFLQPVHRLPDANRQRALRLPGLGHDALQRHLDPLAVVKDAVQRHQQHQVVLAVIERDRTGPGNRLRQSLDPVPVKRLAQGCRGLGAHGNDGAQAGLRREGDVQEVGLLPKLLRADVAGHQSPEGIGAQQLAALPVALVDDGLLLDLAHRVLQVGYQLVVVDGLEQVVVHAQLDGGLQVIIVAVAAQYGDLDVEVQLPDLLDQRQAVHFRHANVRNQYLRPYAAHQPKRLHAVRRLARHLEAKAVPLDGLPQPLANDGLVIHDDHSVHRSPSLPFSWRAWRS